MPRRLRPPAWGLLLVPLLVTGCAGEEASRDRPDEAGENTSTDRGAATAPCDTVADDDLATWFGGSAWVAGPTDHHDALQCRSITDPDLDASATWTFEESSGSHDDDVESAGLLDGRRRDAVLASGAPAVVVRSPGYHLVTVLSWPDGQLLRVQVANYLGTSDGPTMDELATSAMAISEAYDR